MCSFAINVLLGSIKLFQIINPAVISMIIERTLSYIFTLSDFYILPTVSKHITLIFLIDH
jgi:hypothetical protein